MSKLMKRVLLGSMAVIMALSMVACGDKGSTTSTTDTEEEVLLQFAAPESGDEVATIKIADFGEIKIKLFKEQAPKAVENFTTHAKDGYYDGVTFHRVIADFMIQGGDPDGNGTGGESIWGEPFEDEFSDDLRNFTGALSMANSGPNTNGSQFFIVNAPSLTEEKVKEYSAQKYSKDQIAKYSEVGGTPWLDYGHTVFGQLYEGMDVLDKVSKVATVVGDAPKTPVVIESITISTIE